MLCPFAEISCFPSHVHSWKLWLQSERSLISHHLLDLDSIMNSYIHFRTFFKLLLRVGGEYRLLCLYLPSGNYFFLLLMLLLLVSFQYACRERELRVRFSICFHYGSYPTYNWLFYASFCSMSLLDVIYYDFYAGAQIARKQAKKNNAYFSYLFCRAQSTTEMMMTKKIYCMKWNWIRQDSR